MLSSEFNQAMGSLIRSLEAKVRDMPEYAADVEDPTNRPAHYLVSMLDDSIVQLVALRLKLSRELL